MDEKAPNIHNLQLNWVTYEPDHLSYPLFLELYQVNMTPLR